MPGPMILFVCTGNICRSPMAEYLLRERLGPDSPWSVGSAGLLAGPGMPASPEAVAVLQERGVDGRGHRSRPLDRAHVDAATVIVVMTNAHRDMLQALFPGAEEKVFLLNAFSNGNRNADIDDPIGLPSETYERVFREIETALRGLAAFLDELDIET